MVPQKNKNRFTIWSSHPPSECVPKRSKKTLKDIWTPVFIAALFTVGKSWKQPKCPLTDEQINKMWYLHQRRLLFSHSVASNSLWHHGLQHTRRPCPSLLSRVCSNSCPLNWWFHPDTSSSVAAFSSCHQSFPISECFLMCQLFASGGQSIGASASASVLPMSIRGWFPLGLTGLISLLSGNSQESSPAPQFKNISSLALSLFYGLPLTSIHDYWKNHSFDYMDICQQMK